MGVICQRWVRVRSDEKEGSCQLWLGGCDLRWPCYLSRDITLPTKVYIVKAMVLPAVMHGCESWIIMKAEHQRTDAFELWCWRVPWESLESPLDCKEIQPVHPKKNQSWIFIGRIDAEAEIPILWPPDWEELTHWKRPWCWERLSTRGEGGNRG